MRPWMALAALALLAPAASAGWGAPHGVVHAAGVGTMRVWNSHGQLVCTDPSTSIAIELGFLPWVDDVPTGHYTSTSHCASFVYPITTAYECTGGPWAAIHCAGTNPLRSFDLDLAGNFLYLRDNLGIHFEVEGQLLRQDVVP